MRLDVSVVLLAAVLCFPHPTTAQSGATGANLTGVVMDELRAVLPGASVSARNTGTGLVRLAVTGPDGRFAIPVISLGTYTIRVEHEGFAPHVVEPVAATLGSTLELQVVLKLAAARETVTVISERPLVDLQKTAIATVVAREQIEALPINVRNFISFAVITPGATVGGIRNPGATPGSGLTFAGQRDRSNNITVDGLDNNDAINNGVRATFSQEAVREFQVLTNSYPAEFGNASAGVINIVTKSGTNNVSGNAFGFFRNERLNAKDHFEKFDAAAAPVDRTKAPFGQTQLGATLGGPIRKDKTFYFLSIERLDVHANNFVAIDDRNVVTLFGQSIGTPAEIVRRAGFRFETGSVPYVIRTDQALAKIDRQISPRQNLNLRFNWGDEYNENADLWGGLVAKSRGTLLDSRDAMMAGSLASVRSSTAMNELRFQMAYRHNSYLSLDPACDGRCQGPDQGGPTTEVAGIGSVGRVRLSPLERQNLRYQFVDNFTYVRGAHQIKTGVDYSYVDNWNFTQAGDMGGRYVFGPLAAQPGVLAAPVTAIQAFALGLPSAYSQSYGNPRIRISVQDLALFVQDDWRIGSNLTLRIGARYQKQFWNPYTTRVQGMDPYPTRSDNENVAPRISLGWDPQGNRKTTIHGGYGGFYDNINAGALGAARVNNGVDKRTLVVRFPQTVNAWGPTGPVRLPEPATSYPSSANSIDPNLENPYAQHVSAGIDRQITDDLAVSANFVYVRGFNQLGAIDYNPLLRQLGPGRRPEDTIGPAGPVAGTSASIIRYTSFGQTWYRGLIVSLSRRYSRSAQFLASYTLSKAEDTSSDFAIAYIPQNNGEGRDPRSPNGLPVGFDPLGDRGPSVHSQRHRLVLSGVYTAPRGFRLSSIVTLASGRPYNILAGADLNGDGDGGGSPTDRARRDPPDPSSSLYRNFGTVPYQMTVDVRLTKQMALGRNTANRRLDAIVEVFNLVNRTNFVDVNNIFGRGAYPAEPLPTFGQFTQAGPPRQAQLGVKLSF